MIYFSPKDVEIVIEDGKRHAKLKAWRIYHPNGESFLCVESDLPEICRKMAAFYPQHAKQYLEYGC